LEQDREKRKSHAQFKEPLVDSTGHARIEITQLNTQCLFKKTVCFQIVNGRSELDALGRVFGLDISADSAAFVQNEAIIVLAIVSNNFRPKQLRRTR